MSTPVTYAANSYNVPAYQDTGYAQGTGNLSSYLIALATGSLTISGGTLALTADANFGASFGLVSTYYKSRSSNIASAGVVRLANTDLMEWRDNANANNLILAMNATQTGGGTYTIPDIGVGVSANFVMTASAQTIGGAKTFSSQVALTPTTNQLLISTAGAGLVTLSTASHGTSRTYTIPDAGATASFVMTQSAQTLAGQMTFSAALLAANGATGTPSYSFTNATNYGMYWQTNKLTFTSAGTDALYITNAQQLQAGLGSNTAPTYCFGSNTTSGMWGTSTDVIVSSNGTGGGYVQLKNDGNILTTQIGPLGTTATVGFMYIVTCAGAPTGVPSNFTGQKPWIYDTTNNKIWFYNGAWRGVVVA